MQKIISLFQRNYDGERFDVAMKGVVGRRLTFRELCAIDDCGFLGIT